MKYYFDKIWFYFELFTLFFTYIFLECLELGITSIFLSLFFACLQIYVPVSRTDLTVVSRQKSIFSSGTRFFYYVNLLVSSSDRDVSAKGSPACLAFTSNLLQI